ncbi:hypothetical protein NQ317_014799 [Molorchus minor]|uniref:Uncharacterized protein n=1 Tax=Molorchus minor TaxID=1323400 RepID=A0ABQ9IVM6_9CUCU|nr:hypothetical protein NQ317_014799 [Molorchus minor]
MIEKFKAQLKEKRERILALDDMYIEIDEKNCPLVSEMNEELGIGIDGTGFFIYLHYLIGTSTFKA